MCLKYLVDILSEIATWCNHDPTPDPIITIQYGALYNWYTATDAKNITSVGWHIPTANEMLALRNYLDPINNSEITNIAGGLMKEIGTTYWATPNTGATNTSGFNARGAGYRTIAGAFTDINQRLIIWNTRNEDATHGGSGLLYYDQENFYDALNSNSLKYYGASIRPVKDSTILTNGQTGTYTGNDGKIYRTICIGTQELVADNLWETKYRDGSDIPVVTDNATWAALITGAMCYYNNDINNA